MTFIKPRPARIAACLLVGALLMAPLSANAAPSGTVPGDDVAGASYLAKNEDEPAKNAEKQAESAAREEARAAEAAAKEAERAAQAAAKEEARAAAAAAAEAERVAEAAAKEEARVAEAAVREEEKLAAEEAARQEAAAEGDPAGAVTGPGGGSSSPSSVGSTSPEGEVVSLDELPLPTHLSAAMELFDQQDEDLSPVPDPVATPTEKVSGSLVQELAPMLPPMLADVVAAPFVVIEALIDAMAASGQALVIPFLAGAAGFMAPGLRRKHLLVEALGKNPEPVPSNEPRTIWVGW